MRSFSDLEVGQTLLHEPGDRPAVRHRFQLGKRAEIAKEPLEIIDRVERRERLEELAHLVGAPRVSFTVSHNGRHVSTLTR